MLEKAAPKKAPVVWINGFPGTGKRTIANAVAKLLKHDKVRVLDNHKLIDPVEARFPRGHPEYNKQRQIYRQAVLEENVCNPSSHGRLVIFTDFQSDSQLGRGVAKEYAHAASCAGRPFLPIYLICDLEANIERIASTDRVNSGTIKLIDADVLKDIRSRCQLFFFDGLAGLVVDSTKAPPLETAQKIVDMIKGLSWEDFRI